MSEPITEEQKKAVVAEIMQKPEDELRKAAQPQIDELKTILLQSLQRLEEKEGAEPGQIQLAIRLRDNMETGNGDMYYQIMKQWKPLRNANFSIDFLGNRLPLDTTGFQKFVEYYLLGINDGPLQIKSQYMVIAEKYQSKEDFGAYQIMNWGQINVIFFKPKSDLTKVTAGIFIAPIVTPGDKKLKIAPVYGAPKKMETVDIFE